MKCLFNYVNCNDSICEKFMCADCYKVKRCTCPKKGHKDNSIVNTDKKEETEK